jgi:hypothetical protein
LLKKYIKCNIWRVAIRPSYIKDAGFLKFKENRKELSYYVYLLLLRDRKKEETGGGAVRCTVFIATTGVSKEPLLPSACRQCPLILLNSWAGHTIRHWQMSKFVCC